MTDKTRPPRKNRGSFVISEIDYILKYNSEIALHVLNVLLVVSKLRKLENNF